MTQHTLSRCYTFLKTVLHAGSSRPRISRIQVHPSRWWPPTRLYGVITRNTTTLILTAIKSYSNYQLYCIKLGTAVAQWLRCCTTTWKVAGSIPAGVNGFFINIKSFRSHHGPGVDSASNRNEYQEYFLGVKSGRCVRLTTLPPSCAVVTKSGSLNFLEPSGPLQACNGTALPLPFTA